MARPTRIEYEGAVYHVMARANARASLFLTDDDRYSFLKTLAQVCKNHGWRVHAYSLMGTHYHALIETPEPNLVSGMQWLQTTYSVRFNKRNKRFGHVFAGRYKALPVEAGVDDYFTTLLDYIHLNAPRAGLVEEGEPVATYP